MGTDRKVSSIAEREKNYLRGDERNKRTATSIRHHHPLTFSVVADGRRRRLNHTLRLHHQPVKLVPGCSGCDERRPRSA